MMPRVPPSSHPSYDVDKLKKAVEEIDDVSDDFDDMQEPNYECQTCGWLEYIEDHQVHTPNWCKGCEDIKTFEKL